MTRLPEEKYPLATEARLRVYFAKRSSSVINRLNRVKDGFRCHFKRWESVRCVLSENELSRVESHERSRSLRNPLLLSSVFLMIRKDPSGCRTLHYSFELELIHGFFFIQTTSWHEFEQWFYSIQYQTAVARLLNRLEEDPSPNAIIPHLLDLAEICETTELRQESLLHVPLRIISPYLIDSRFTQQQHEELVNICGRLFKMVQDDPAAEVSNFIVKHADDVVFAKKALSSLASSVRAIMKCVNVTLSLNRRNFIISFLQVSFKTANRSHIEEVFANLHSYQPVCPHFQVVPNTMSLFLCCINRAFYPTYNSDCRAEARKQVEVFQAVTEVLLTFDDWRGQVFKYLQEIPFPDQAFNDDRFTEWLHCMLLLMGSDECVTMQLCLLPERPNQRCLLNLLAPSGLLWRDTSKTFSKLVEKLWSAEHLHRRVAEVLKASDVLIMAKQGNEVFLEVILKMLEINNHGNVSERRELHNVLTESSAGQRVYDQMMARRDKAYSVCGRIASHSLETIDLSHKASVTGLVAFELIHFNLLRRVNLSYTNFDDSGLRPLCDFLRLETLNLCETLVTDDGLDSLVVMSSLSSLDLSGTRLSEKMFLKLMSFLPKCHFTVLNTDADLLHWQFKMSSSDFH